MGKWLLIRLAQTGGGAWLLASLVFLLSHQGPTDAALLALPDNTDLNAHTAGSATERDDALHIVRHRLGLDLPLFYASRVAATTTKAAYWQWHGTSNQYHKWTAQLIHGKLGLSLRTGQPVADRLRNALTYTLPLTGLAILLTIATALVLAQRLAARPWWHRLGQSMLAGLQALPLFIVALILLLMFANPAVLNWLPAYGLSQPLKSNESFWTQAASFLSHAVLPVVSLTLTALPALTLQLEAALEQELRMGYATTARAKGLAEPRVIRQHALRNALLPMLTQFTELLPALVAGAVVVEVIFAVPGMGRLLAEAAATRDYPVLIGGILLIGTARFLSLFLADALYSWADPRIRWQQ
jgi:peptide/nickel transport system permease protein